MFRSEDERCRRHLMPVPSAKSRFCSPGSDCCPAVIDHIETPGFIVLLRDDNGGLQEHSRRRRGDDPLGDHLPDVSQDEIGSDAAITFAVGFYDRQGARRDFENEFKSGRDSIDLKGIPGDLTPVLQKCSIGVT
jgi:hypothetical protein